MNNRRTRNNRGKNNNGHNGGGNNRSRVYDSNGPDVRIRGNAHQVVEKYLTMAKDCASSGDRVMSESYYQHAEHYQRLINSWANDQDLNKEVAQKAADTANDADGNNAAKEDLGLPASILAVGQTQEATEKERELETA